MKINLPTLISWRKALEMSCLQLFISGFLTSIALATGIRAQAILDTKVTIQVQSQDVKSVLALIEEQTKIRFLYSTSLIQAERKVSLHVQREKLGTVLEEMLKPLNLGYEVSGKQIILNRLPLAPVPNAKSSSSESSGLVQPAEETITGTIADEKGEGLPGVSIIVKGTQRGTTTDGNGQFRIQVPDKAAVLVFSYVGYLTQEIPVGTKTVLNVTLVTDEKTLSEIIVVGYGTQKKRDLTGAISSISSKDIAETPSANFLANAQGRLAGVDIVRANGAPGSNPTIRIRGNRSINASNNPLYVIDGIPTDVNINDFNPNDIESMEVLKDASAVAIYGSRGANGVILITTKRGKEGKTVLSYDGYYGVKKAKKDLNLMNGEEFVRYARISRGLAPDNASQDASLLSSVEIDNLAKGLSTNWLDLILRDGVQQSHQLSASGGSKNTTYYLSGSFFDEKGVMQKSDYRRYSFRANIDTKLTERLRLGVSATVSTDVQNLMANAPYTNALTFSPLVAPYDANGGFLAYPNPREGNITSPLLEYQPNQFVDERKKYRIFATIFGEYTIAEGLTYRLNYGPDFSTYRRGNYNGTLAGSASTATVENQQNFAYTLENLLSYNKKFGAHSLNVVGLFSTQKNRFESSSASGRDIPIETSSFYDLGSATTVTGITSSLTQWGLLSYMGRINYGFKDRYLLTLTGRADGSSRLSKGNKWAFFPSVSAGWVISDEAFLSGNKTLSFLKLRVGYGEVGNTSIAPYQTLGGLGRSIYAFGNDPGYGYGLSVIPNPDLKWEISKTLNVGFDFGFLGDRITGSIERYDTKTSDLLLSRLIPISSGYASVLQNIGATRNRGWELTLNGTVLNTSSGFKWDAGLNLFANKEEIVDLFNGKDDVGNQWFIGQPISVFYNFKQLGIWQTGEAAQAAAEAKQRPGDIKIADVNGRDAAGNLTNKPDGVINSDDRTVLGSTVPKWSGGLTNRFSFKGIDFSFLVYARQGQMLRSDFHNLGGNQWQGRFNSLNFDYWTPTNPSNSIPMPYAASAPLYADAVRFYDGSFVKIRNITLGYSLPKSLLAKVHISSLRIYGTADNAFIFSPYKLVDPESSTGIVGGATPMTSATYVFGLNLKF
ncbi:TonB-dependent receptor [Larkinella rosea]|uniref:SusC/RagA family TonB-linked outer membrane protein n=1 Tax=Larkinella rosea TaxID=2025312 RepID=A0A3P1BMI1_9BACT|nr:TonB-dependent receptor [Larkinella rosea]RRB02245.1 SusC/RagA family TonB-linked outer membrane protein [Larkinella rosea]